MVLGLGDDAGVGKEGALRAFRGSGWWEAEAGMALERQSGDIQCVEVYVADFDIRWGV